jgi:hypothetical protein
MANAVFTKFKENLLAGLFDLDTNTIKAALIDGYTPNLSTHATLADAKGAGATQVGTDQTLTGKAVTNGAFTASTVTWTSVAGGNTPDYVLVYQDGAGDSTRYLIALIDTTTGVTLPVTTNGGNITLTWSTSVFTL